MMNFSGNAISSKLLLVLCVSAIALAVLTLLPEKQKPVLPPAVQHHTGHRRHWSLQNQTAPGYTGCCLVFHVTFGS